MRSSRPFVPVALLAVCLLAAAPAVTAEPGEIPRRMLKVEPLDVGLSAFDNSVRMTGRVATVTCMLDRWRFGVAFVESDREYDYGASSVALLPVHAGFSLLSNPKRTVCFYGFVPDIYGSASVGFVDTGLRFSPMVRVGLCCDLDYYGFGVRAEGGWVAPGGQYPTGLYWTLQLRFLTFGIGF